MAEKSKSEAAWTWAIVIGLLVTVCAFGIWIGMMVK